MANDRKEAFLRSWFDVPEGVHWAHGMANEIEQNVSACFDRAIEAWNAPAATDTGLETAIASVVSEFENVLASFPGKHDQWLAHRQRFYAAVQATRSQAYELLATKDYLLSVSDTVAAQLQNTIITLTLQKEDLETKLAEIGKQKPVGSYQIEDGQVASTTDFFPDGLPYPDGDLLLYTHPVDSAAEIARLKDLLRQARQSLKRAPFNLFKEIDAVLEDQP